MMNGRLDPKAPIARSARSSVGRARANRLRKGGRVARAPNWKTLAPSQREELKMALGNGVVVIITNTFSANGSGRQCTWVFHAQQLICRYLFQLLLEISVKETTLTWGQFSKGF
jgi:hypothetical protein